MKQSLKNQLKAFYVYVKISERQSTKRNVRHYLNKWHLECKENFLQPEQIETKTNSYVLSG